jgi:hypothetical protein
MNNRKQLAALTMLSDDVSAMHRAVNEQTVTTAMLGRGSHDQAQRLSNIVARSTPL